MVGSHEEVIGDLKNQFKTVDNVIVSKVILNPRSNHFHSIFVNKSEVKDGVKVTQVIGVCTRFLEDRGKCSRVN